MSEHKTINDTIYGTIRLEGSALELMETLELQRLNSIRQLGLTYLVFPGANHSRLEHVLGVHHVAKEISKVLKLPDDESDIVSCAALLHDVGHGPFSHTLEHVLSSQLKIDHMEFTKRVIIGEEDNVREEDRRAFKDVPRIADVLERHGIDPKRVANLISGYPRTGPFRRLSKESPEAQGEERSYLAQMIHSTVDADQIDYLLRDAHYTGVAHGMIDFPRLIQTLSLHNGNLVVDRKGLSAVEGMLVARALMYSSVYFHKTVRICETMLARAVERVEADVSEVQRMVDSELMSWLLEQRELQREIALRLRYRKLFKRALVKSKDELSEEERKRLLELRVAEKRRRAEDSICRRAGISEGRVIIDIPLPELLLTEPRISMTDIGVLDDGRVLPFRKASTLGRALQAREVSDWVVMVACDPKHREAVGKAAQKILLD